MLRLSERVTHLQMHGAVKWLSMLASFILLKTRSQLPRIENLVLSQFDVP